MLLVCRERNHKIIIGTMAGVIPNTAQREEREDMINVYFADSLPSFVNDFSLPKVEVCAMEEKLVELLAVSYRHLYLYCTKYCTTHINQTCSCGYYCIVCAFNYACA